MLSDHRLPIQTSDRSHVQSGFKILFKKTVEKQRAPWREPSIQEMSRVKQVEIGQDLDQASVVTRIGLTDDKTKVKEKDQGKSDKWCHSPQQ